MCEENLPPYWRSGMSYEYWENLEECSFIFPPSATLLDLSMCEYNRPRNELVKAPFPFNSSASNNEAAGYMKEEILINHFMREDNSISYLDCAVPNQFNPTWKDFMKSFMPFRKNRSLRLYPNDVVDRLYSDTFADMVLKALDSSRDIKSTEKYLKPLQFVFKSRPCPVSLGMKLLNALYFANATYRTVRDFLKIFEFRYIVAHHENPEIVAYLLHCSYKCQNYVWETCHIDMVLFCICNSVIRNLPPFLKYSNGSRVTLPYYENFFEEMVAILFVRNTAVISGQMSKERHFLALQIYNFFAHVDERGSHEAMCLWWRSIPDAFLTVEELNLTFSEAMFLPAHKMISLQRFYSRMVGEDNSVRKPRSLQHLCRVVIRNVLSNNHQLPDGIDHLGLPRLYVAFLKLETDFVVRSSHPRWN
ncbi:SOCS box domain-containing protein [Caerostris darwini]|uniref:SOCS box domain-containing protein n=1 Tax=Caerostris darwini TaxID=1538125 RepID=A0AAV4PJ30_9ARAC|nr:SOCS box domain-containing protein [Caerostris darwini]